MRISDILLCQKCKGDLSNIAGVLQCVDCGDVLKSDLGIVYLQEPDDYYWGEISQADMKLALSVAMEKGWRQAVDKIIIPSYADIRNIILGENRADWLNLINKTQINALDIGSGWGQVSFLLAKEKSNSVVSIEKIRERALFQAIRKQQDNIDNLEILCGDFFQANFIENTFDLISLIGVFEWVGVGREEASNPRDTQLIVLKKIHSLLKKEGCVCIGIENRIGFNNFLGAKDHTGLRFTSLMPRRIADLIMRIVKPSFRCNKKSNTYATYTYSLWGYRKLLKEAGFEAFRAFVVHPRYSNPRCFMEINDRVAKNFFSNIYKPTSSKDLLIASIFRSLSWLKVGMFFAPHYLIFGFK